VELRKIGGSHLLVSAVGLGRNKFADGRISLQSAAKRYDGQATWRTLFGKENLP